MKFEQFLNGIFDYHRMILIPNKLRRDEKSDNETLENVSIFSLSLSLLFCCYEKKKLLKVHTPEWDYYHHQESNSIPFLELKQKYKIWFNEIMRMRTFSMNCKNIFGIRCSPVIFGKRKKIYIRNFCKHILELDFSP